tara:strand:+ start:325 stop:564 length:240 start_codon:yes stop_codon:yes gene_type:complete
MTIKNVPNQISGPGLSDKNMYARTDEKSGVVATRGIVTDTPRLFMLKKRKTLEKAGPANPARQNRIIPLEFHHSSFQMA